MTDIAVRDARTTDLSIESDQSFWTDKQRAALIQLGVGQNVSDADLAVFFHQVARTGLDPFARQIYMIERWTKNGPKQTIQTGIDGFRLIARRATDARNGTFGYEPTEWCGTDGQWRDVWLSADPPAAARVTVTRDGARFPAVALWTEYVQTTKQGAPTQMWASKGALMLAKCAEALALRKAFPQDLSGIYTGDEMGQADQPAQQVAEPAHEQIMAATEAILEPPVNETPETVGITSAQTKKLHALANELGLTRDDKLKGASHYAGREVTSTAQLTKAEAARVIDALEAKAAEVHVSEVIDAEVVEDVLPEAMEGPQ